MKLDKAEVSRRQLGAALHLFVEDADPVSVHLLAAAGAELAQGIAEKSGVPTFRSIMAPGLSGADFTRIRNQHSNSFKHFSRHNGTERDDAALYAEFSDRMNDDLLLIGWLDWGTATGLLPLAAQCFQAWFFAVHPEVLASDAGISGLDRIFPGIQLKRRGDQKEQLRRAIRKHSRDRELVEHAMTERRALLLPNDHY